MAAMSSFAKPWDILNALNQVAWQVGQNYLGILGTSLWSYGMPKVASKIDQADAGLQNAFCVGPRLSG